MSLKIAVSGKGGVGKTTISGTIARMLARKGYKVLAVDADPSPNLAMALGVDPVEAMRIRPLASNIRLIREKTGVEPGMYGMYFRLTFTVDDIVERFSVKAPDGVRLIVMGTVEQAGEGCMCPANAVLRSLMRHLVVERDEAVVMDMEAGVEHLKRGTAEHVEAMLVVAEPYVASFTVANHIINLSRQLGIKNIYLVGNMIRSLRDKGILEMLASRTSTDLLALIPYDPEVENASKIGVPPIDHAPSSPAIKEIGKLLEKLEESL